jgi:hypothetical protein
MKIHNPNDLLTLDYRTIRELQGDLKDLHHLEQEKLKRVLDEDGFDVPLFVWKNPKDSQYYLLDGHQRCRVLKLYDMNDAGKYDVPVIVFAAATEQLAKRKLLRITSQYGRITREGLDEFIAEAELDEPDMLDINFDAIVDFNEMPEPDEPEPKDPTDKVQRWTIEDLRQEREKFFIATKLDDGGFVAWLER